MALRINRISLRAAILLLVVVIGGLGPIATGVLHYHDASDQAYASAVRHIETLNAEKSFEIERHYDSLNRMLAAASVGVILTYKPQADDRSAIAMDGQFIADLSNRLDSFGGETSWIDELFVASGSTGEVVTSTNPAQIGKDRSGESFFRKAHSGFHVEPPFFDLYRRRTVTVVARPILHPSTDSVIAVLGAYVEGGALSEMLKTKEQTYSSEDTYLINQANLFASVPKFISGSSILARGMYADYLTACLDGASGSTVALDYRQVETLVAYRPIEVLDSCLITQLDTGEVSERLASVAQTTSLVSAMFIGLSVLGGLLVVRPLLRGLTEAQHVYARLNMDDLDARLPSSPYAELQDTADSFNRMINERQAATRQLEKAYRAAQAATDAKSRFVASVTHELRTPLTGLLGMLDLARLGSNLGQVRRHLGHADTAGRQLLSLVNQVLDFSKIAADRIELQQRSFLPSQVMQEALSVFGMLAAEKGLSFEFDEPSTPPPMVLGDPDRLSQIVFNLMGNAVKFTDAGTVCLRYRGGPVGTDRWSLSIMVEDTGPGIPANQQDRLFEEFTRVDNAATFAVEGTGLGLAIVHRLVTLMEGTVRVESTVGRGTRFSVEITLPVVEVGTEPERVATEEPDRGLSILAVDDVDLNRMLMQEYLAKHGHVVETAANGQICLDMLAEGRRYDVILMDIRMPVVDGMEATRLIRAMNDYGATVPIIALTADAFREHRAIYAEAGMTASVAKPIDWPELFSALARVTRRANTNGTLSVATDTDTIVKS